MLIRIQNDKLAEFCAAMPDRQRPLRPECDFDRALCRNTDLRAVFTRVQVLSRDLPPER